MRRMMYFSTFVPPKSGAMPHVSIHAVLVSETWNSATGSSPPTSSTPREDTRNDRLLAASRLVMAGSAVLTPSATPLVPPLTITMVWPCGR